MSWRIDVLALVGLAALLVGVAGQFGWPVAAMVCGVVLVWMAGLMLKLEKRK